MAMVSSGMRGPPAAKSLSAMPVAVTCTRTWPPEPLAGGAGAGAGAASALGASAASRCARCAARPVTWRRLREAVGLGIVSLQAAGSRARGEAAMSTATVS